MDINGSYKGKVFRYSKEFADDIGTMWGLNTEWEFKNAIDLYLANGEFIYHHAEKHKNIIRVLRLVDETRVALAMVHPSDPMYSQQLALENQRFV